MPIQNQNVVSAKEAPLPSPACRHSENMPIMRPICPAGPPVDVGMRIDVASIDMVSEVNMVSGLGTGSDCGAYADTKWTGPRALCVSLAVISPRTRESHSACAPHSGTHTLLPLVCIFDTHTGYCGVPEETCSALFGERRAGRQRIGWGGV